LQVSVSHGASLVSRRASAILRVRSNSSTKSISAQALALSLVPLGDPAKLEQRFRPNLPLAFHR